MQLSKTKWPFKSGALFWLALVAAAATVTVFNYPSRGKFCCGLVLGLLFFIIFQKNFGHWLLLLAAGVLLTFACSFCLQKQGPPAAQAVLVYPDQAKIKNDYLLTPAQCGDKRICVRGPVSKRQQKQLAQGNALWLVPADARLQKIPPARNFGQADFRQYYASQNIYYELAFKHARLLPVQPNLKSRFHRWRFALASYLQKLPANLAFFSQELLLAQSSGDGQGKTIMDSYRTLGVIHLLSISGLHVALYCWLLESLCARLHMIEQESFVLILLVLLLGLFLSGFQPGFVRACLAFFFKKIGQFRKWGLQANDCLGLTLLCHLLLAPNLLLNLGAQLSYLLFWGLQLVKGRSKFAAGWWLNWLIAPLLLASFYNLNVLTSVFSLVLVPYFNFFVMPLTFIGTLVRPLAALCDSLLGISENFLAKLASGGFGVLNFGKLTWWQALIILLLTVWFLKAGQTKRKLALRLTCLAYVLCFMTINFPWQGQVTFIDVGQGDSILLTTPLKRHAYLIDTGGKLNFGQHKKTTPQTDYITLPFLKAQGIRQLDGVFLSHQDADHIGDLAPLLNKLPVKRLYFAQGLEENQSFQKRLAAVKQLPAMRPLIAGDVIQDRDLTFRVVHPAKPGPGKNEDSLCLLVKAGPANWLFTGDLGQAGEKDLLKQKMQVDYLKLGHHGSKTASAPEFLRTLAPKQAFISAGVNNRYGHPHPETLATLHKLGLPAANTADCGMISWRYDHFGHSQFNYFLKDEANDSVGF